MPHTTHAFVAPLRQLLAGALIWAASSAGAWAAVVSYDILLDTDNNSATGCTVATARGNFAGVERVLTTNVNVTPTSSTVTGVTVQSCESGALGALRTISTDSWPVGSFALPQTDPVEVVETFLPLAELGQTSTTVRAGIVARTPDGGDALLGADLTIRRAAAPPGVAAVPTLSPLVLALLAAGIGLGGAWLARRHQASMMVLGICVLMGASGMAWAATMLMDGQTSDWSSAQQRLRGDGQNKNLVGLWFDHDAQKAYFRIDACQRSE
ncbi:hypothetical protein [Ottowia thiooxydans]|uniref:hypothetical protein n=1 Tax=Ottowia thiooxydans TaxID=219182 RepID=UPI00041E9AA8|nr:hypothetical protein [Ottowia thiooxydans]